MRKSFVKTYHCFLAETNGKDFEQICEKPSTSPIITKLSIIISDPFVKITLCLDQKPVKTKKTSVKKNTIDPVFNESLTFNLTAEQLAQSSFVITVWDYNSKSRDDFVGRIVLGKHTSGPYEMTHWNRMLQCHRTPVAQWHTLRPRAECDAQSQVSPAVS